MRRLDTLTPFSVDILIYQSTRRLSELLNKVWGLADLIKARFSRGYAKTVDQSCFQRGDRACGLLDKLFWLLLLPSY